jgi:hypothetical protein
VQRLRPYGLRSPDRPSQPAFAKLVAGPRRVDRFQVTSKMPGAKPPPQQSTGITIVPPPLSIAS